MFESLEKKKKNWVEVLCFVDYISDLDTQHASKNVVLKDRKVL